MPKSLLEQCDEQEKRIKDQTQVKIPKNNLHVDISGTSLCKDHHLHNAIEQHKRKHIEKKSNKQSEHARDLLYQVKKLKLV
jgi:hypothetical protein